MGQINTDLRAVSGEKEWWITSIRAYSVSTERNLAQTRHNATTTGMRLVSLAHVRKTYVTAMLMRDVGAVQARHRR
jgi:hypothetical protein